MPNTVEEVAFKILEGHYSKKQVRIIRKNGFDLRIHGKRVEVKARSKNKDYEQPNIYMTKNELNVFKDGGRLYIVHDIDAKPKLKRFRYNDIEGRPKLVRRYLIRIKNDRYKKKSILLKVQKRNKRYR